MAPVIVLSAIFLMILVIVFYKKQTKKITLPANYKILLNKNVSYYRSLNQKNKIRFEEKISDFLSYVRIEGVDTEVNDLDKLLVASSAIIPIFGFERWTYYNLNNVLLYPDTFNKDEFLAGGYEKNTLGMVGNGPMQRMMILSKPALHAGFTNGEHKENTGIHEFVHLLDKEDGDVDGLPEVLLNKKYNAQWLELVNESINEIMEGHSDINSYGASNKAEFFAVASEYFFNNPTLFKTNHPALYELMSQMFNQHPGED